MEQIHRTSRCVARPGEAAQKVCEWLLEGGVEVRARGDILRQQFGKLPKLEKTGVGICWEIMFRQRRQPI